jgi:hypothetical protein
MSTATVPDPLLYHLKRGLLASTSVTGGDPNASMSVSEALSDYYLDKNYGLGGAGAEPKRVRIVMQDLERFVPNVQTVAGMFAVPGTPPSDFASLKSIGEFVRKAAYLAVAGREMPDDNKEFIWHYDIQDPDDNRDAVIQWFTTDKSVENDVKKTSFVKNAADFLRQGLHEKYSTEVINNATQPTPKISYEEFVLRVATVVMAGLNVWLAYQYIDHVPVGVVGGHKYDSFLETQVRQLTKVVFVANLLRAAHNVATTETAKAAIQTAFNSVLALPAKDPEMLGEFLSDRTKPKHLDNLYKANVEKSAELYDAATDLEEKDLKMRQAQDNLRAINTNDELMTTVRRRAYILYVVVWVMMAALVGALSLAMATGSYSVLYVTAAVVCALVLVTEVTRGVGKLLQI